MAPTLLHAATLALRAAASICPTSPICPQDDQCTTTANGVSLQVSCATDYYGGDLQLAQTSTLAGCINACATTTDCVAASYVGENCYLKSVLNAASENANVIGVVVNSRDASTPSTGSDVQTCPASFTCPDNNGCSYIDGSRSLILSCGVDFYGGDYASQYAESLQDCTQACAADSQCAAASFVGGKGAGTCYLKATKNGATINDNVNAVSVVNASVQTSSTTSSTSITASPSASAASSSTVLAPSGTDSSSTFSASKSTITSPSVTASSSASPSFSSTSSATVSSSASSASSASSDIASSSSVPVSTSSAMLSSSTFVSSTPSTSTTASATPICDKTNLVANPSFETNTGSGSGRTSTSWTSSSSLAYPVNYQNAAHTGKAYMILYPTANGLAVSVSQKISSALDVSQTYTASFYLFAYQGSSAYGCSAQLYANDVQIFSQAILSFSSTINYVKYTSSAFTPSSSGVTLKVQYQCTSGSSDVVLDDVSLTTACA